MWYFSCWYSFFFKMYNSPDWGIHWTEMDRACLLMWWEYSGLRWTEPVCWCDGNTLDWDGQSLSVDVMGIHWTEMDRACLFMWWEYSGLRWTEPVCLCDGNTLDWDGQSLSVDVKGIHWTEMDRACLLMWWHSHGLPIRPQEEWEPFL